MQISNSVVGEVSSKCLVYSTVSKCLVYSTVRKCLVHSTVKHPWWMSMLFHRRGLAVAGSAHKLQNQVIGRSFKQ